MDYATLYHKLPTRFQHLACTLYAWRNRPRWFGRGFRASLGEVERRGAWPAEQLEAFRAERLRAFLAHCAESVPAYRHHCAAHRPPCAGPDALWASYRELPVLTKADVQEAPADFVSCRVPPRQRIPTRTSGSTGAGLQFATTAAAQCEQWAVWWRYRRWHGIEPGTWCGHFGGRHIVPVCERTPPFWRYNYCERQVMFSAYHLARRTVAAYVAELRRRRPPWLHGYASVLAELAGLMLEEGLHLGYTPHWVTTGGENVLAHHLRLIERAFGVRAVQHYGMVEAVANCCECPQGRLHIDEDFAAVEFLPTPHGPGYRVVGTNWSNLATPLLRYDTGDVVQLDGGPCPCGRPGRTVRAIDGRCDDFLVLRNGVRVICLDIVFEDLAAFRECQLYQASPGQVLVRFVPNGNYTPAADRQLLQSFRRYFGDELQVRLERVAHIPRTPAGKFVFVVRDPRPESAGA